MYLRKLLMKASKDKWNTKLHTSKKRKRIFLHKLLYLPRNKPLGWKIIKLLITMKSWMVNLRTCQLHPKTTLRVRTPLLSLRKSQQGEEHGRNRRKYQNAYRDKICGKFFLKKKTKRTVNTLGLVTSTVSMQWFIRHLPRGR